MGHLPIRSLIVGAGLFALATTPTFAASFVNGNFESGSFSGYTLGAGNRAGELNPLNPQNYLPGGSRYDAGLVSSQFQIINKGTVDPLIGAALGSTVYNGNYSGRLGDLVTGGNLAVVQQQVNNYTDKNISFAYKAVLEGAHGPTEASTVQVTLTDLTTGLVSSQVFNAADDGSGVSPIFSSTFDVNGNQVYYTPNWQIVTLDTSALQGDSFLLQVLAADCTYTGHYGYLYLDGLGTGTPPVIIPGVPLPKSLPMFAMAVLALGAFGLHTKRSKAGQSV